MDDYIELSKVNQVRNQLVIITLAASFMHDQLRSMP